MILQGTTPTLTISIDPDELSLADIEQVELVFSYPGTCLIKTEDEVTIDISANTISYKFSEAETLALPVGSNKLYWQLRLKTSLGVIVGTVKQTISVGDLISTEAMNK